MSIIPNVKAHYHLGSDEEFRVRYYVSRIGFESAWHSASRKEQADIEHFYQEHDSDIWRQAYLSRTEYIYRKKILSVYHAVRNATSKDAPVLDYGCGAGAIAHYWKRKGIKHIHVADIPSATLDFVSKAYGRDFERVITIDGTELRDRTGSYGAIAALDCLEHTTDPLAITERLVSALKERGLFIVNYPLETDFSSTHTREGQRDRSAVFVYLRSVCDELIPEFIYKKR